MNAHQHPGIIFLSAEEQDQIKDFESTLNRENLETFLSAVFIAVLTGAVLFTVQVPFGVFLRVAALTTVTSGIILWILQARRSSSFSSWLEECCRNIFRRTVSLRVTYEGSGTLGDTDEDICITHDPHQVGPLQVIVEGTVDHPRFILVRRFKKGVLHLEHFIERIDDSTGEVFWTRVEHATLHRCRDHFDSILKMSLAIIASSRH